MSIFHTVDCAVASICGAQNKSQLVSALGEGMAALGFQSFNLSCNKADVREFMTSPTLTSWTSEDLDAYHNEHWSARDPLLELSGQPGLRKLWTPDDWARDADTRAYAEYIDFTGIRSGVTASVGGATDTVSAITALSFSDVIVDPDVPHAVAILAQTALTRAAVLGVPSIGLPAMAQSLKELSGKQIEILKWASQGKSNRDIATIMGSSKRTIDYHMSEILRKLDVASRAQAIIIFSGQ